MSTAHHQTHKDVVFVRLLTFWREQEFLSLSDADFSPTGRTDEFKQAPGIIAQFSGQTSYMTAMFPISKQLDTIKDYIQIFRSRSYPRLLKATIECLSQNAPLLVRTSNTELAIDKLHGFFAYRKIQPTFCIAPLALHPVIKVALKDIDIKLHMCDSKVADYVGVLSEPNGQPECATIIIGTHLLDGRPTFGCIFREHLLASKSNTHFMSSDSSFPVILPISNRGCFAKAIIQK
jgi:hypothetical protein